MSTAESNIITKSSEEELKKAVNEFLATFSYDKFLAISYAIPVKGNGALYSAIIVYRLEPKQVL